MDFGVVFWCVVGGVDVVFVEIIVEFEGLFDG